jgi:hypothetical protein
MRALALAASLMVALPAAADDDDPKSGRSDTPAPATAAPVESAPPTPTRDTPAMAVDEDDPKLARGLAISKKANWRTHYVPRVKLGYRRLSAAGLEGGTIDFNVIELSYYPSSRILRFGMEAAFGWGADPYNSWFFTAGAVLGVQYPWRVTPFIEARFNAGLLGGSYMGQSAVSWVYTGGIDTGIEVYVARRFYLSAAIGWVHPTYSGIDVEYVKAHPQLDPERKEFANDSFTFKFGIGL